VHPVQTTITGNAGSATKLQTARTITLSGDVTGAVSSDLSGNPTIPVSLPAVGAPVTKATQLAAPSSDMTVITGITTDSKGRVTGINTTTVKFPTVADMSKLPVITTQPTAFTFSRLKDEFGDPNGPTTVAQVPLSVAATGDGVLSYQWYKNGVSLGNATGAQTATYTVPAVSTVGVANWGLNRYYCEVRNATGSVRSQTAEIAIGCGARSGANGWLKFMCHNLGAVPLAHTSAIIDVADMAFSNDSTSRDAKGWLFQWGRVADGHQWRSSPDSLGQSQTAWNVADVGSGKFYRGSTSWRKDNTVSDNPYATAGVTPCPTGWFVPSQNQLTSLFLGGGINAAYGTIGTFNTWTHSGAGNGYNYVLKPDGETITLFLPAAGFRDAASGNVIGIGTNAAIWTRSADPGNGPQAYEFGFDEFTLYSCANGYARGYGMSVRCVASQN
jgi:uncharacterized protein (TIGR02145 family)